MQFFAKIARTSRRMQAVRLFFVCRWRLLLTALIATLMAWKQIFCLCAIVYNYSYWVLFYSTVKIAAPQELSSNSLAPKILHQTWRDESVPIKWKNAQASCKSMYDDYEYQFWTDASALELIKQRFPWFLETYNAYPYNIQRADAMRYFILFEYGGMYLDLDVQCTKKLDYLRDYNFTAPKTYPIGFSNDVLVAKPGDPFLFHLIHNLHFWSRWFAVKYATVMFSTGPMFVTVQYSLFDKKKGVTLLPSEVYGKYMQGPDSAFIHLRGSSWHGQDAKFVFWIERYWIQLSVFGGLVFLIAALSLFRIYNTQSKQNHRVVEVGSAHTISLNNAG
ncbi:hypothetical protein CEUSTIGMA_g11135.t1 [Chlamydomonas eustigma]|uniref:Uncharacterized protein n=1 Tax=Chlamydomonas eustigma TaxID=1157962 RepID=A0A250XLQ0_9CHLO|nr:hypothetical protein CEUSTIGMA_g11135.t1 [Chlamydomonas eustigma]|eukprot:GAX83710.1 hypothetical protein CEUSTIGMA_g11135.t1 [Chlamydomonas eustigma]